MTKESEAGKFTKIDTEYNKSIAVYDKSKDDYEKLDFQLDELIAEFKKYGTPSDIEQVNKTGRVIRDLKGRINVNENESALAAILEIANKYKNDGFNERFAQLVSKTKNAGISIYENYDKANSYEPAMKQYAEQTDRLIEQSTQYRDDAYSAHLAKTTGDSKKLKIVKANLPYDHKQRV